MPYVCSTGTNDTCYCEYTPGGGDLPVLKRQVLIKGGANRGGKHLVTPQGIVTSVSDEDLAFLKTNKAFLRHMERGFVTIIEQKKEPDADKVAKDMTPKDGSAPKTADDYGDKQPVVGKPVSVETKKKGSKAA
jgi:hypothetical protein